jgi:RND family efflux transporter MFP subunit
MSRTASVPSPRYWSKAALVAVMLGLAACNAKVGEKKDDKAVKLPPSPYATISNGKVDVEGGVIAVAARRAGVVKEVLVQEGDEVTQGQVLARQEDQDTLLAVGAARAAVAQAESAMNLTRVNIDSAHREYDRLVKLAPQNYVAQQKLDQAQDAINQGEATLKQQAAAVQTSRAALAQAQYNNELTYIRAPVDGRIVRRYANPGAGASTLNVTAMFDLEPKTERIVRAEIIEASIPVVTVGQEAEIVPESDESKAYVGTVKRVAPIFGSRKLRSDDATEATDERVVEVVVTADNTPFLIGQRVLVKFMKPGQKAGVKRETPKPVEEKKK